MATPPHFRGFTPPIPIFITTKTVVIPTHSFPSYAMVQALAIMVDRANSQGRTGPGVNLPNRVEVIFVSDDLDASRPPATAPSGGKPADGGDPDTNKPLVRFPMGRTFNVQNLAFQLLNKFQFLDPRGNPLISNGPRSPSSPANPLPMTREQPVDKPIEKAKEAYIPIPENNRDTILKKAETFFKPIHFSLVTPDMPRPIDKRDPIFKTTADLSENQPKREERIEIKPPSFQGEHVKKEMQPPPQFKEVSLPPQEQSKETPIKGEPLLTKPEGKVRMETSEPKILSPMNKTTAESTTIPNTIKSGDMPVFKEVVINEASIKNAIVAEAPEKNLTLGPNESRTPAQAAQEVSSSGVKPQPQAPVPPQSPPNPSTGIIGPAITTNSSQGSSSRKKEKKKGEREDLEESFDQEEDLEDFSK